MHFDAHLFDTTWIVAHKYKNLSSKLLCCYFMSHKEQL